MRSAWPWGLTHIVGCAFNVVRSGFFYLPEVKLKILASTQCGDWSGKVSLNLQPRKTLPATPVSGITQ